MGEGEAKADVEGHYPSLWRVSSSALERRIACGGARLWTPHAHMLTISQAKQGQDRYRLLSNRYTGGDGVRYPAAVCRARDAAEYSVHHLYWH